LPGYRPKAAFCFGNSSNKIPNCILPVFLPKMRDRKNQAEMASVSVILRRLGRGDLALFRKLNVLFGDVFADTEMYAGDPPPDAYLEGLLAKDHMVAIVALAGEDVVGGLVAYELEKFERARSEFYIYDLAVSAEHRRRRIATSLIRHLRRIAARRSAWVIFVQADYGDNSAIALYEGLGSGEEVLHFDIVVPPNSPEAAG
jgi:aminoglycoside 3-N-acetyltransferase I